MENIVDKVAGTLGDIISDSQYKGDDFEEFIGYCEETILEYVDEERGHGEMGPDEETLLFQFKDKYYQVTVSNIEYNRLDKIYYFREQYSPLKITYKEVEPILPTNGIIDEEWINRGSVVKEGKKIVSSALHFPLENYPITLEQLTHIKSRLQIKGYQTDQFIFEVVI